MSAVARFGTSEIRQCTSPPVPVTGEALLRYALFFWIMYKIYIFMQCAPILRSKIQILFLRAYA